MNLTRRRSVVLVSFKLAAGDDSRARRSVAGPSQSSGRSADLDVDDVLDLLAAGVEDSKVISPQFQPDELRLRVFVLRARGPGLWGRELPAKGVN